MYSCINNMETTKFKLIKSNRRTLALHISNTGELIIKAPKHLPRRFILNFIDEKKSWIHKKQLIVKEKQEYLKKNKIKPGNKAPFLGEFYEIMLNDKQKLSVIFDNKFILNSDEKIMMSLVKWYKIEAANIIPGIVECEAMKYNFKFSNIKITSAKKRWGSCTSKGNLNFSWRLITLPEDVVKYVVMHELAHLKALNHSKNFWAIVEKLLPNYRFYERWLKKNSYKFSLNF